MKIEFSRIWLVGLLVSLTFGPTALAATEEAQDNQPVADKSRETVTQVSPQPQGVMQLDETVISGNQELPKVLYILPWREPEGLPQIEITAELTQAEVFRRLYPPAYRRELRYFETLQGLQSQTRPDQEE